MIRNNDSTSTLCKALLSLKSEEECYQFLEDICTVQEISDLSQRLKVALLLDEKASYRNISQQTGASTATISRVCRCYEYGSGGYRLVIDRLKEETQQ